MGEKNLHFSREFKRDAMQLVTEKGMLVGKVAREPDIHPNLIHLWRKRFLAKWDERARVKRVEESKKIVEVISYVGKNLDWIEKTPKVKGYGYGPVEKTLDIAVARRFKKSGMSWYRRNANPLLKLRLLKFNGERDAYWKQRKKEFARYAAYQYHGKKYGYNQKKMPKKMPEKNA